MTIRRGVPWGRAVEVPGDAVLAADDRDVAAWLARTRPDPAPTDPALTGRPPSAPLRLVGGDLARTVGAAIGSDASTPAASGVEVTLDALRVRVDDGDEQWAVAHVVVRRSWWRGGVVAVMNAQYLRGYDVAPRSHPNDGMADVLRVDAALPLRSRLQAVRRARTGTHLPHPALSLRRERSVELRFDRPVDVYLDGQRCARARTVHVRVEPDAFDALV